MKNAAPFYVGLLSTMLFLGCSAREQASSPDTLDQPTETQRLTSAPPPKDNSGDLEHFHSCSAESTAACANAGSSQLRGHYYWGLEVETFHPCGSKQSFWVVGDDSLLHPLRHKSAELYRATGEPYLPIYIEAFGIRESKESNSLAIDSDGVYRLTSVQVATDASPIGCSPHG